MANYAKAYTPLFHPILDKLYGESYKSFLSYLLNMRHREVIHLLFTYEELWMMVMKITNTIDVVIENDLVTIKLDVLTQQYLLGLSTGQVRGGYGWYQIHTQLPKGVPYPSNLPQVQKTSYHTRTHCPRGSKPVYPDLLFFFSQNHIRFDHIK